jgi:hypothetical protein
MEKDDSATVNQYGQAVNSLHRDGRQKETPGSIKLIFFPHYGCLVGLGAFEAPFNAHVITIRNEPF